MNDGFSTTMLRAAQAELDRARRELAIRGGDRQRAAVHLNRAQGWMQRAMDAHVAAVPLASESVAA